jgi:predicted small integral membrane protein
VVQSLLRRALIKRIKMNNRILKIGFSWLAGIHISLIVFNNISDYGSNFQFVQMVAKMEDVFSAPKNNWRSIHSTWLYHAFYFFIILLEAVIAMYLLSGGYKMFKSLNQDSLAFAQAKQQTTLGFSLGIFLWFFGFLTVAGEWFLMWQSTQWNAQQTAFSLTVCFLLFLIFHNQTDE